MAYFHGKTKSDLVVTVRNGKRQCFFKENGDNPSYSGTNFKKDLNCESTHCNSSVQVTDGRYASTYQISHCHVSPTSPSEELTEFPLQRKLLNSGDSHFKVGTGPKNVPRSSEPLRRDNPNAIENMPRLKHADEFLSSLRKYSKPSYNKNLEITEKNNGGKHAKNPLDAPSSANKTDEPLALEERSQCNNFISKGEAQKCEISKWLREDRAKHGTKPSFTTAIDVRELQKSTRKDKESLRSVTLPNIAYSIDPSFFLQEEIEADTISPELKANNIQILQDMQFIKQNRKETEIQTEINTVSDANKITLVKNGLEMLQPHHFNNYLNYKTPNIVTAKENKCFNVNLDIPNYQQVFPESNDVNSNSNDEFLKDAIKRWVQIMLIETGRCTDHDELNFVFQYLLKHLKILKNYNYFILNSKSQYTLKTIPFVNNDDLLSTIVSDENDTNNMTIIIERLTDMLMEKIRLIYKKQYTVHNNTVKRNLKIKEILPTLGDDFYKENHFQKGLFKVDQYPETEKKIIIKESGNNNTSTSFSEIQTAIQDWLDLLDLSQDLQNCKNIAIVSLASEIKKRIDRQNYIKSRSPSYIVSDEIELEYLHYLIFKWNNKYFSKQRIEMLRNVKTLFYSIRKLR
ncbi:uncharacterized protein LOC121736471 [Aricia agestis]|uniref:uncharacterized protein LOC121736471 n=1 Tax=Aricia agestis TaxID=91739 RepID=UPI001C207B0C|nr:uncharacterized protein LOC121736471 [Aricia agestis]